MPKRASTSDGIDPVRSRLAAAAAAPVSPRSTPRIATENPAESRTEAPPAPKPVRPPKAAALTVNRKIMVSPGEAARIEETIGVISASFSSKVSYSQVSRAIWSVLAGAEDAIRAGARRAPKLKVPSKGDHVGMAEYEEALADFLITALKRS